MSVTKKMQTAAHDAARFAAGQAFGEAITEAHPGLPALEWSAIEIGGEWYASGSATGVGSDARIHRAVAAWAAALGGPLSGVDQNVSGTRSVETKGTFDGVEVTVWGILADL